MGLFGNLFRNPAPQPTSWGGSGNAPFMVGQPGNFGMSGQAPDGFAPAQQAPHQGRNWGQTIASFLTNFSASQGDPAALERLRMATQQQQQDRQRESLFSQFQREQEYRQAHPNPQEPDEFTRTLVAGGYDPNSPEAVAMYRTRAQNLANPPVAVDVQNADGSTERRFITRPSPAAPPPPPQPGEVRAGHRFRGGNPADPASWEPLTGGGAGPSGGPATFPRQDGGAFDFRTRP